MTDKKKKEATEKAASEKVAPKKVAPKKKTVAKKPAARKSVDEKVVAPAKKAVPKAKTAEAKTKPIRKKKAVVSEEEVQKLRIRVMAYEHKILDSSVRQIMDTALRYDAKMRGPVPLPTEKKKYTVNRSSFVHKDSREQFEMRTHKRLIDIINPRGQVIEALTNLTLPSGVSVDVKML